MSSARKRKTLDVGRLAMAIARPGIDLRTWNTAARIDDDPDAISWHPQLGWLVDVSPYGGELQGDQEVTCRVATPLAGAGVTETVPLMLGCEVHVQVTDGSSESNPVIIGMTHNAGGCEAPTSVAGIPISGLTPTSVTIPVGGGFVSVSPFDCELHVSPYARVQEFGGRWLVQAPKCVIEASEPLDAVLLGSRDAPHPVVLGDDYTTAVNAFVLALETYTVQVTAAFTAIPPAAPLGGAPGATVAAAAATALATAGAALAAQLLLALSLKVKTE